MLVLERRQRRGKLSGLGPCVYILACEEGALYVGESRVVQKRVGAHGGVWNEVAIISCPEGELMSLERDLIKAIRPPWNGTYARAGAPPAKQSKEGAVAGWREAAVRVLADRLTHARETVSWLEREIETREA